MEKALCPLCRAVASIDRKRTPEFTYVCCRNCKDFMVSHGAEALLPTRPLFRSECVPRAKRANSNRLLSITATPPDSSQGVVLEQKMVLRSKTLPAFNTCISPFRASLWLT